MPPVRMPTYGETPSNLHAQHHAARATHEYACFAAVARGSCVAGLMEPTSIPDAADALPSVTMELL